MPFVLPSKDCPLCPRLCDFREQNRRDYPGYYNAPVPSFGSLDSELLIVGLAPGLHGANQTGRPFTGDYAGIILYQVLLKCGFAKGHYNPTSLFAPEAGKNLFHKVLDTKPDTLELVNCRITNAVRCVPQENKPEPSEIKNCNAFLEKEIAAMPNLKLIISLGLVSHNAVLRATGQKLSSAKFVHGALHSVRRGLQQLDSYHCSRYNINTGTLTPAMFDAIIEKAKAIV